ncbi:NAD(P)H-binding protein [Paracidovorax cattleyae]|uniref:NAD(P)H dehydrogenase (Quinone) n=1 Tax=Paracidovorax cattleyae TaxID=80868 RepID=A0A1H0WBI8_9BURK|nr:NAD(P)H-binding protein [Paracidovorax cattleyae]SDP87901.1 NAD(P)H dehydrogenase (quinone) [Paracidovorax cattleyae]
MTTFAVTGAGGQLGQAVLRRLLQYRAAGDRVVACSREPGRRGLLQADEVRRADFHDPSSLAEAFAGVDRLLLVSIEGDDDQRVRAHAAAAEAAQRAGVRRIVYTSFIDVDSASPSVVARVHRESEAAIRATGCECALLRDGPYLENMALRVATAAREGGVFHLPGGDARLPYIGREDLADAAVAALQADVLGQSVWRLTGPRQVSFGELCDAVGRVVGLPVRYAPMDEESYARELEQQQVPPELRERRLAYARAMREGFMTAQSDDFRRLTGREPDSLEALLPTLDLDAGQRLH